MMLLHVFCSLLEFDKSSGMAFCTVEAVLSRIVSPAENVFICLCVQLSELFSVVEGKIVPIYKVCHNHPLMTAQMQLVTGWDGVEVVLKISNPLPFI